MRCNPARFRRHLCGSSKFCQKAVDPVAIIGIYRAVPPDWKQKSGPRRIDHRSLADGQVAEWLKAHAWNACIGETLSRVRIPLSPPLRAGYCLNHSLDAPYPEHKGGDQQPCSRTPNPRAVPKQSEDRLQSRRAPTPCRKVSVRGTEHPPPTAPPRRPRLL